MKRTSPPVSPTQAGWLLAAAASASLPLLPHLPSWLLAFVGLTYLWRLALAVRNKPMPSRLPLVLAVVAATVGIYLEYRSLFGQNAGIAMLSVFLALKQLETKTRRDGLTTVFLAYFVALAGLLQAQAIVNGLLLAFAVAVTTATLAALTDDRLEPKRLLGLSSLMLAQATPFLLILFVLFPRINGPLWGMPRDTPSARTGLSDTMSPGSIGNLSLSDAIAFRVSFDGALPRRDQLYWRGPVLNHFDGRTWRAPPAYRVAPRPIYEVAQTGIAYEITLEAHRRHWHFMLELPTELGEGSLMAEDYLVVTRDPVLERKRYRARSLPDLRAGADAAPRALEQALQLPAGTNPRIRAQASEWRQTFGGDPQSSAAIVDAALAFFRKQELVYTLTPKVLNANVVDEFLFDTRQGFCEHFSSAFVFAMRAAGVPARVVTGYQGGEVNPVDGNLVVRQYDAHAWAEVWLPNIGWLRIDPTAVSAPSRIQDNLAAAVPAGDPLPLSMRLDAAWLRDLRFHWDAAGNAWNQWVLGYNPERQLDLLARLGMRSPDWRSMTVVMTILCSVVLAALTAWALLQRRRSDPAQAIWRRLTRRLERRGIPFLPWEGPLAYARRAAALHPELGGKLAVIAKLYAQIRYDGRDHLIPALRRHIAAFKP